MAYAVYSLTRFPGLHHWPEAPEQRAYLRSPHRHLFHVRAGVTVVHSERDVEFHDLGRDVSLALTGLSEPYPWDETLRDFGPMSCEHIAGSVAKRLRSQGYEPLSVSCSEDDEFTAVWIKD